MDDKTYKSQYRLPMLVANWLRSKAATHFRSMNAELIAILHAAMQQDEANRHPDDDKHV